MSKTMNQSQRFKKARARKLKALEAAGLTKLEANREVELQAEMLVREVERVKFRRKVVRHRKGCVKRFILAQKRLADQYVETNAKGEKVPKLRILAEGDSWFDFPFGGRAFENGDVIAQLSHMIRYPILNLGFRGDEVRQILGVEQRVRLWEMMKDEDRDFNALLFSGGGNDLVGDAFCLWIRSREAAGGDVGHAIDEVAFGHMLGVVRSGYEQLIGMRNAVIEGTGRRMALFFHGYDYAIPTGKDVCGVGPWMRPSLDYRGWTKATESKKIVKQILTKFSLMLGDLSRLFEDVYVVPTQGTLKGNEWNDELHPKGAGFKKIAGRFVGSLKAVFPDAGLK